jgi:hypothetical protein
MNQNVMTHRLSRSAALLGCVLVALAMLAVPDARAALQFSDASVSLTGADGTFSRQAGAHPDFTLHVALPRVTTSNDGLTAPGPPEVMRTLDVDLPQGFVGNPTAFAECDPKQLQPHDAQGGGKAPDCPVASQIGIAHLVIALATGTIEEETAVYNLSHGPDVPAAFGLQYLGTISTITARVRPGDYGISSGSFGISQAAPIQSVDFTLWGVPADPSHDAQRQPRGDSSPDPAHPLASQSPRVPFLTNPTSCTDQPVSFTVRGDSWEHPGAFDTRTLTADADGTPFIFDGCDRTGFAPTIDVQPLARIADAPSGLNVDLEVPQSNDPDGYGTANVRRVVTTLPEGVTVSPSSAVGLGACSPGQVGLGSNDAPTCPNSAKIGSVTIDTPLLPDPLEGDVVLATQNNNPFNSLIALYIVAKGPGFYLKLPGKIDLDQTTGRITATFDNTPQLPFSRLHLVFNGGADAPLAMPQTCGTSNTHAEITSWASDKPVVSDKPMTIDQGCDAPTFAPSFTAGTTNPQAGQFSPFSFNLTRADRTPYLSSINTTLPAGLLAEIGSVPQCPDAQAATGACPAASEVGSTHVLSGPGTDPLALSGHVYLTGPYRDAPFGLAIAVPTAGQAGPFDLGTVVVRARIYVDRTDAHVTVKSDPLPTIIQGIPLRLRQVNLTIDRKNFMFNPTSCDAKAISGAFGALNGATSNQLATFRVGGCGDLDLGQQLALSFTGKSSTKDGTHPGVVAKLTDKTRGANLKKVEVKLPLSVALDPDNAQALCKPEQRAALNCPKTSIVGSASAMSVLKDPIKGPVYFVEGLRKSKTGRTIRTLPKLWIPLSGDGVTIDVNADSAVDSTERLVTTFNNIPDAPIKSFDLKINGGKHGILVVSGNPGTCDRDKTIDMRLTGQNGQVRVDDTQVKVEGCKPSVTKTKVTKKSLQVTIANVGAGKVSLNAPRQRVANASRVVKRSDTVTLTTKLSKTVRSALAHHHKAKVTLRITYRPKGGKALKVTKRLTLRR